MKRNQKRLGNKGFSLVELIVVIAIMAVLVGVLAPTLIGNIEKSRESKDFNTLDTVYAAVQTAYGDEAGNIAAKDTTKYATLGTGVSLNTILANSDSFATQIKEYLGNATTQPELTSKQAKGNTIMVAVVSDKISVWVGKSDSTTTVIEADKTTNADGAKKNFSVNK